MDRETIDKIPLCVDLDGTLVKTDVFLESLLALIKKRPWYIFHLFFWLCKGRAHLKREIAARVDLHLASLPYCEEFVSFLQDEFKRGRRIVLATASDARIAHEIAGHLPIFSDVLASQGKENLRGKKKGNQLCAMFGERGFVYAGNAGIDVPVWQHAAAAIVVNAPLRVVRKARKVGEVDRVFASGQNSLKTFFKAIRIHQWGKNFLLFVPLVTAHKVLEPSLLLNAFLGFLAFSLCSSSGYLLNDLMDLESDRQHPRKKKRPLACGNLSLQVAFFAIPLFLGIGAVIGYTLDFSFFAILMLYFTSTLIYSLYLKEVPLLDVLCLAFFYVVRVFAGAVAVSVFVSQWLFAFSTFLFLSLAFLKRFTELQYINAVDRGKVKGRGYVAEDTAIISHFGVASGYLAVLIFALYINSEHVTTLYTYPHRLWGICPIILYWISRVWLLGQRRKMHDDPVIFTLRDKSSYIAGLLAAGIMWIAM